MTLLSTKQVMDSKRKLIDNLQNVLQQIQLPLASDGAAKSLFVDIQAIPL